MPITRQDLNDPDRVMALFNNLEAKMDSLLASSPGNAELQRQLEEHHRHPMGLCDDPHCSGCVNTKRHIAQTAANATGRHDMLTLKYSG